MTAGSDDLILQTAMTDEDLAGIIRDVWSSFTGMVIGSAPDELALDGGQGIVGRVAVTGEWQGQVLLVCPRQLARTAAATMFDQPADKLTDDEVADAVGELTNMLGGNIKSMLPGPSGLSLPEVTTAASFSAWTAGAALLKSISLTCEGLPLTVSIWRA